MNAAIRAVVRGGISKGMEVYGVYRGYEGLIEGEICKLESKDVGDILFRGGTILKSARCARFHKDEWVKIAAGNLQERGIDAFAEESVHPFFHKAGITAELRRARSAGLRPYLVLSVYMSAGRCSPVLYVPKVSLAPKFPRHLV